MMFNMFAGRLGLSGNEITRDQFKGAIERGRQMAASGEFGGMRFGEVNVGSRVVYALVGLSALYLATQLRALVGRSEPTPAKPVAT